MPLFSLITPVYNVEDYLPRCIESMIKQSFKDIEIILVDDGSQDKCPQICDQYAAIDPRVKVIHKENGGIVSARQVGSNEAKGDYIINVDGDDWIAPDYCEKMAQIIWDYNPDIVMCGHYRVSESRCIKWQLPYRCGYYSRSDIEKEIFPILIQDEYGHSFNLSLWAKAIKSTLQIQQQLMDVVVSIGEDTACMAPCIFHSNSLFVMKDCLYFYRQNLSSITRGKKAYRWDGPEIRGRHLEEKINMDCGDLRMQSYRGTVHALFTVVKSQFNRTDVSTKEIIDDIKNNLNNDYYREAIAYARFKGFKAKIMHYSLKYRLLLLVKAFNSM